MKIKYFSFLGMLLAGIVISFSSCLRLDSNLYNLSDKITEYKLDNYTGTQDFILDASYTIPDSLITKFTLSSQAPGETSPTTIHAIYIGSISKIATDTVIMYCHGNKWHMDFYWQRAKLMANTGSKNRFGVLMIDYRGFGLSEGTPSEDGLYADVDAALKWLNGNGLSNSRLVMYGFSMGSAPATKLTAEPRSMTPSKLILEAPFASADVMAADGTQLNMPGSYFTNLKLNNAEEIKLVQWPLCWIHGMNDNFLNYQTHGQVVYDNYNGSYKEKHLVEGADHGEIPAKMGFAEYNSVLLNFITQH
ncbi:MAG: alpha/beta fold hydrolase [Bacteroidetes bacterium]|nr:alpha/beta fold hydrolase [Bacteroidota bacterium]